MSDFSIERHSLGAESSGAFFVCENSPRAMLMKPAGVPFTAVASIPDEPLQSRHRRDEQEERPRRKHANADRPAGPQLNWQ